MHGQLFEYLKNEKPKAKTGKQRRRAADPVQEQHLCLRSILTGAGPKVFDGRNSFLHARSRASAAPQGGQPRTLPAAGSCAAIEAGEGSRLVTIYDPLTTTLGSDGKTYVRRPSPGT
jgi:hypothetical protein